MNSVIIGAGGYGRTYLSYLQEAGVNIVGLLDDNKQLWGKTILGTEVIGGTDLLKTLKDTHNVKAVYCPIGTNHVRVQFLELSKKLGYSLPNFIHRLASVGPNVEIGEGVYIIAGTVVMPTVKLEDYVMISMGALVGHDTVLKKGVFLSMGSNTGGGINVGEQTFVGMGSTIMSNGVKSIGKNCTIGAGAVIIKDVPDNAVVAGVPAKILRYKEEL